MAAASWPTETVLSADTASTASRERSLRAVSSTGRPPIDTFSGPSKPTASSPCAWSAAAMADTGDARPGAPSFPVRISGRYPRPSNLRARLPRKPAAQAETGLPGDAGATQPSAVYGAVLGVRDRDDTA